jgi:hypothetical protein
MALMGTMDTYSWFSSTLSRSIEVSAASTSDIFTELAVTPSNENPTKITLKGADSEKLDFYEPILYFAVEGEAAEYIIHINPIRVKRNDIAEANIKICVDQSKFSLLKNGDIIKGSIYVKYLNEFIDEKIDITFTGKYLRDQALGKNITDSSQWDAQITRFITDIAQEKTWEEANWTQEEQSQEELVNLLTADLGSEEISLRAFNTTLIEDDIAENEIIQVPISPLAITEEQKQILDIIIPKASQYLQDIYNVVVDLVHQLNEKIQEIAQLKTIEAELSIQLNELEVEKETLLSEKEDLQAQVDKLKLQNEEYQRDIHSLISENQYLTQELIAMEQEIDMLRSQASTGGAIGNVSNPVVTAPSTGTEAPTTSQPDASNGQTQVEQPSDLVGEMPPQEEENPIEQPGDTQQDTEGTDSADTTPTEEVPELPDTGETDAEQGEPIDVTIPANEAQEDQQQESTEPEEDATEQGENQEPVRAETTNPIVVETSKESEDLNTVPETETTEADDTEEQPEVIYNDGKSDIQLDIIKKEDEEETYLPQE